MSDDVPAQPPQRRAPTLPHPPPVSRRVATILAHRDATAAAAAADPLAVAWAARAGETGCPLRWAAAVAAAADGVLERAVIGVIAAELDRVVHDVVAGEVERAVVCGGAF